MNISNALLNTVATLTFGLAAGTAAAHDYWLEPVPAADGATVLRLFVGECLKADEEKHHEAARTLRFDAIGAEGSTDLRGTAQDNALPLLSLPASPSQRLIVLDRDAAYIELDPKKFDAYLHEEGLETVRAERAKAGETGKPGRERYTRFLKTLTPGQPADEPVSNQTVGQALELIPMEDPSGLKAGERLHLRLLLDSAPLMGAKVSLCMRGAGGKVRMLTAVTDRLGDAAFSVPAAGLALVRAVHMRRVTDGDTQADWESLWSSYSFIVPGS